MKCVTKEQFDEYKGIWALAEVRDGELQPCSAELVSEARRLADAMGTEVTALLVGKDVAAHAKTLAGYGADKVLVCENELLKDYSAEPYAKVICQVVEAGKPDVFLVSATTIGRDLAPRCAAKLCTGLNADCTLLHIGTEQYREYLLANSTLKPEELEAACAYEGLKMTMPAFGGHMMATITCPDYRPQMATVRPGVMQVGEFDEAKSDAACVEYPAFELEQSDVLAEVKEVVKEIKNVVDVTKAEVVVGVGMGIRKDSKKGLELAQELADVLGGVVGCTRDVMNEGWLPEEVMIGQTGRIVRPKLYIALGISGAIQHQGGMKDSEFIVAVNNDKRAPMFEVADVALVGDLFSIVPAMIKAAKEK
jgi:electron transfer flavoprotein alpha subunit